MSISDSSEVGYLLEVLWYNEDSNNNGVFAVDHADYDYNDDDDDEDDGDNDNDYAE